ncbi:MAG: glycogen synthase GlgA [Candidatus Omnitrophica bacterium]|nr:glycogen synthase GlgA [Candidatus Omnitrophota bacterium]MCM8828688.1 glycogen synthase GlgA [Candidatus Omnitrophota bacterium]
MKSVAIVSCESVPFVKVGGLADVVGALCEKLPRYINSKVFLPGFKQIIEKYPFEKICECDVVFSKNRVEKAELLKLKHKHDVYLIGNDHYFNRDQLYGEKGIDYPDNLLRFSFFSKAVLECCKKTNISVDVFHCNDWQTALVPLYRKLFYNEMSAATVFTIHNLAYQGIFPAGQFEFLGLGNEFFTMDQLEFYGDINIMKAGIIHSEKINTVSPTYAKEILTEEFGCRLDGLLKTRERDLAGILNGVDYMAWNPLFDRTIARKYRTRKGKLVNKIAIQEKFSLTKNEGIAVFGFVGRFVEQKGIDLIIGAIENLKDAEFQFVCLGTGDASYENAMQTLARKYPEKIGVRVGFDDALARQIYAGSDFFLMPSRFEPCGLGQLISLKYGTIPIVRSTGGLSDTVKPIDPVKDIGWGIVFSIPAASDLEKAMWTAIEMYNDVDLMERVFKRATSLDFSWNRAIESYLALYKSALEKL